LLENPASTVLKLCRPDISFSASVLNQRWPYDLTMQTNCSSTLGEKPTLVLQLSSPSQLHERRKGRNFSPARIAATPIQHAGASPLWITAKSSLASCERLERAAWLVLALGSAAALMWSLLSLLA